MSHSRRSFLKFSGLVSASALTLDSLTAKAFNQTFTNEMHSNTDVYTANAQSTYWGVYAIHQGLTFEDVTYFNILRGKTENLTYEVVDSQNRKLQYVVISEYSVSGASQRMDKIRVNSLKVGESYRLRIVNSANKVLDERIFKSLDTKKKNPKLGIASCMNDSFDNACVKMWKTFQGYKPDLIFLIGDTCYSDNRNDKTQLGYWGRYAETRSKIGIFRERELTPILAVWDDHDFGDNNADGSSKIKYFMKDLFTAFWLYPEHTYYRRGVGVAQVLKIFGHRFHLMDSRFHRNASEQWGKEQEDFLFQHLTQDKTPSWIMNGSQFFGGYLKKDAFEYAQPANFKQLCAKLAKVQAPVAFVSGDVHFSETMKIEPQVLGYQTFEITSSAMHSFTVMGNHNRKKNPRRLDATSKHNFNIITLDNTQGEFKFDLTCSADNKVIYQRSFAIKK
ncbi:MAG: hypothetical protein ACK41T_09455 [Pseudobdellovibrio sp.]